MVQISALFALVALSSSQLAFSRPLSRRQQLSDDDLLQNGLEAQKLNAAFQTLDASDPCTTDDVACVGGALAVCRDNGWVTQSCPPTLQCFALPEVDQTGVTIGCTSSDTAAGLIEATGAVGGVNSTDFNSTITDDGSFTNSTDTGTDGVTTVTVTVTLPADGQTQTLPASTATLTPDQAGSIISGASPAAPTDPADSTDPTDPTDPADSTDPTDPTDPSVAVANADGATTIILGSAATPTPPPTANDNVQGGLGGASTPSGTTIFLNGADASAPTTTPDAAAAAPSSPAPAAPAAAGGYY